MVPALSDLTWPRSTERLRLRLAVESDLEPIWRYRRLDSVGRWMTDASKDLDAFVMATNSTNGAFTVDNYGSGSPRGTFHLRGGSVTNFYGAFYTFNSDGSLKTGFARDFHYDRRGLIPPSPSAAKARGIPAPRLFARHSRSFPHLARGLRHALHDHGGGRGRGPACAEG